MLEELHVAGLRLVEEASLEFALGLNVLTGETGAGKTMMTVGLALALGARGSSGSVRSGERAASVEARFSIARAMAGEIEALPEDDPATGDDVEVVLARTVSVEGRGSARVNGKLAPLASLSAVGERLVEIHGQNHGSGLLAPQAQAALLDRFAGKDQVELAERYRVANAALRKAEAALRALDRDARERERERDLLRYQIREIEAANVAPGEMASLAEDESRLAHAERILDLAAAAEHSVGEEGGAADRLGQAAASAQSIAVLDPPARTLELRLRSVAAEAADVLAELEGDDADRADLAWTVGELALQVEELAGDLTRGRTAAAPRLAGALAAEVRALGMPGAEVDVELAPEANLGSGGAERSASPSREGRHNPACRWDEPLRAGSSRG